MTTSAVATPSRYLGANLAWYLLGVLLIANVLSFVDRQILTLLVQPIRSDLAISDTEISLLQGFAFTILYSILGLPLGRYADAHNRRNLIIAGIVVWSAMTIACGLAQTYGQLFAARVGVGIGEATLAPAAYSMICDAFRAEKRGTALGVYSSGIYLGIGASVALGGFVLAMIQGAATVTLPFFGTVRSWQAAFICVGAPGLLVALLMLTVPEPERAGAVAGAKAVYSLADAWNYLMRHRTAFFCQLVGFSLIAMAAYGTGSWMPTVFIRVHEWKPSQAGINYGLAVTLFGTLGGILGGYLGDRWLARGRADARLMLGVVVGAVWIPVILAGLLARDPIATLALMGVASGFSSMVNGLGPTSVQDIVPGPLRGQATALFFFVINMLGLGVGPTAIAMVTDRVFHDDQAVPYSILAVAVPAILAGMALLYAGRGAYRRAAAAVAAPSP